MSGHQGRVRKSSPKQGPMKATIPIASVLKGTATIRHPSPTRWRARISPDHPSGQRSPGSTVTNKARSKTLGGCCGAGTTMRRTASLDTIYLKGQWPRDNFYLQFGSLQVDKSTQTDDMESTDLRKIHSIAENYDEKLEKMIIRQRLQRNNNKEYNGRLSSPAGEHVFALSCAGSQTKASYMLSPTAKASPINIPVRALPKPTIRNSVEGLNQELEKLFWKPLAVPYSQMCDKSEDYDKFCQATPEGHRAPLAELFKATRSVNTQTPAGAEFPSSCQSSGPPSRDSLSPLIPGQMDSSSDAGGSQNSSPDQESGKLGTSPHINKFLAREPPDGCEKVHLKSLEERRALTADRRCPRPCTFQLKPSQGSAFQLLQPNLHTSD